MAEIRKADARNQSDVSGSYHRQHVLDGTWAPIGASASANDRPTLQYRLEGDRLHMASSAGQAYTAEIGSGEVALEGAPPGTTVVVRKVPAIAYREIVMRDGRPIAVRLVAVTDGKVATIFENRLEGSAPVYAAIKD